MTASVQNLEPTAAYVPLPQSTASSDKKSGAADAEREPVDFRSELELQDPSRQEAKSADRQEKSPSRTGKKPASPDVDELRLIAVTPLHVPEPQKIILPITLMLGQPEEQTEEASPEKPSQEDVAAPALDPQSAQITSPIVVAPVAQPASFAKLSAPEEVPASNPDPKVASTPTSSESQPISKGALKLPENTPLEPAPAVQEPTNSEPSRPPVLAFAARVTVAPSSPSDTGVREGVQEKKYQLSAQSDQSSAAEPEGKSQPVIASTARVPAAHPVQTNAAAPVSQAQQTPAIPDAPTTVRMPARYAAVAPILPKADKELDPQLDLKKYAGSAPDRSTHAGTVLARVDTTTRESAGSSQFQAPPPPASATRTERVVEPPAAPAATPHEIRIRVPDNNGGSAQVRFVESGGEVRVSVRTADVGLAQNLRTHLNDLSQRLADGGAQAEIWKPGPDTPQSQNDHHQPDREGRGSGGQQPGSQGRQQDQQEKRPAWLEEMEASLQD